MPPRFQQMTTIGQHLPRFLGRAYTQHDACDHGAQQSRPLVLDALVVERDLELGDLAPINSGRFGCSLDRARFRRLCNLALDLLPPLLQRPQAVADGDPAG